MSEYLQRFENLLSLWAGHKFPESRRQELERAFNSSLSAFGCDGNPRALLDLLEHSPSQAIKSSVMQKVLVGETYFFRDQLLWQGLKEELLPDLCMRMEKRRSLRVWSAGCSTGEEPYSMAIVLQAHLPLAETWQIDILGTDISEAALQSASRGIFGTRAVRDLDLNQWGAYFTQLDDGSIRLKEKIRDMVHFSYLNLAEFTCPDLRTENCDIILCRNVFIYLRNDVIKQLVSAFCSCLNEGGVLLLAPTEIPIDPPPGLKLCRLKSTGTMYLRKETAVSGSVHQRSAGKPQCHPATRANPATRVAPDSRPAPASDVPCATPSPLPVQPPQTAKRPQGEEAILEQIRLLANKSKLRQAHHLALILTQSDPANLEGWLLLALIYEEMNQPRASLKALRRLLDLDRNNPAALLHSARLACLLNMPQASDYLKAFYANVEGLAPETVLPHSNKLTLRTARLMADNLNRKLKLNDH